MLVNESRPISTTEVAATFQKGITSRRLPSDLCPQTPMDAASKPNPHLHWRDLEWRNAHFRSHSFEWHKKTTLCGSAAIVALQIIPKKKKLLKFLGATSATWCGLQRDLLRDNRGITAQCCVFFFFFGAIQMNRIWNLRFMWFVIHIWRFEIADRIAANMPAIQNAEVSTKRTSFTEIRGFPPSCNRCYK